MAPAMQHSPSPGVPEVRVRAQGARNSVGRPTPEQPISEHGAGDNAACAGRHPSTKSSPPKITHSLVINIIQMAGPL